MYKLAIFAFLFPIVSGSAYRTINMLNEAESFYNFPKGLLSAIGRVESGGRPEKFSPRDGKSASYGFMQIKHATAKEMGFKGSPKELLKLHVNIKYGSAYLASLRKKTKGDLALALTCYNAGPNSEACRHGKYGTYVGKVFNAMVQ